MKTHTILEKGSAKVNEDYLVAQDDIFGVFDGATSLSGQSFGQGETGGMIASRSAGSVFSRNHYPLTKLARQANEEIMSRMIQNGVNISRKENLWSTSAAVVRIKNQDVEWVQTGDAVILLIYEDGSHRVLADREDHDFDTLNMWKTLVAEHSGKLAHPETSGKNIGALRQVLKPQIVKVRSEMNISYGVLNGEPRANNFLCQGTESLKGVSDLLIFTDGLAIPKAEPEKVKDYSSLVNTYLKLGLDGLKNRIRRIEKTDPHCIEYPRFKCHDDIAAITLKF